MTDGSPGDAADQLRKAEARAEKAEARVRELEAELRLMNAAREAADKAWGDELRGATLDMLRKHVAELEGPKNGILCGACGKSFVDTYSLEEHLDAHAELAKLREARP